MKKTRLYITIYVLMCTFIIAILTIFASIFYISSRGTIISSTEEKLVSNVNAASVIMTDHLDDHIYFNEKILEYYPLYIELYDEMDRLQGLGKDSEEIESILRSDPNLSPKIDKIEAIFDDERYTSIVDILAEFTLETDVTGMYTIVPFDSDDDQEKDTFVFVFDTDQAVDPRSEEYEFPGFSIGDPYVSKLSSNEDEIALYNKFYEAIEKKNEVIITREQDQFGSFFMGFKAILDKNGEVIALMCVDIEDSLIRNNQNSFFINIIVFELVILVTFIVSGIFIYRVLKKNDNMQEEIERMAYYDSLTKLPNRAALMSALTEDKNNQDKNAKNIGAILFIDLDNFKKVNDTKGHLIGDKVLQDIADFLRDSIGGTDVISKPGGDVDFIARLGGDEFVILLSDADEASSVSFADKLHKDFSSYFKYNHIVNEFSVSLSIGIELYDRNNYDPNEILRKADEAMYKAKKQGKGKYYISKDE
ncbi:GGDEF domain-containing protein [Acholeplasma sp. OttesenSCG-928-E16]|nr:GGDEF domain-containing protein [Acholeplasma sp. OttesenSCG-928-E16]